MVTVLVHEFVTGGGLADRDPPPGWAAEGAAIRRALAADFASAGAEVVMTLDARHPVEPGPWRVARVGPGEECASLARLAARLDWTALVAPETGGLLEARARLVERAGGRSLGATPRAIALAGDKLRLAGRLAAAGVRTPPTLRVEPARGLPSDARYPAVLKPVDGAGALDTFLIAGPDDPLARAFPGPVALLQPREPGTPSSATFLIDREGRPTLVAVGRQEFVLRAGRFAYQGGMILPGSGPVDANVWAAVDAVDGLRGLVGVDYLWDEGAGRSTVLEINPRPTTSCVGLTRALPAGALAGAWLGAVGGRPGADGLPPVKGPTPFKADGTQP